MISSYACDHMTADAEFLLSKAKYRAVTGREQRRDAIGRDQKRKDKEHDPAQRLAAEEQGQGKQVQHHTGHNENRSCH